MTSQNDQSGQGNLPEIDVRVDLDLLDEAARERVAQVIKKAFEDELAKQPLPQAAGDRTMTVGLLQQ